MKIKILLIVASGLVASMFHPVSAQENPLVSEFKTFVGAVEADGKNYTKEQWDDANRTFDDLVAKFKKTKSELSKEEKNIIHDAIGRYKAAVTNSGIDSAIKGMTGTYNSVADATTGAFNETKGFFNGIFKKKNSGEGGDKDAQKE